MRKTFLQRLLMESFNPTVADYEQLFDDMLQGQLEDTQLAGILVALRLRGEDERLLTAGAKTMRRHSVKPSSDSWQDSLRPLADNCGTGGDGADSFNISTAAAVVASACGVRLAKHGNRSVSSRCGSADLLFAAGFSDSLDAAANIALLKETGFTFFFAPQFHPMMRHVMPVRKTLAVPTVFNLLGPLANPLSPDFQLIGVSHKRYLVPMATALANLGVTRAMVVSSEDGLDEISPAAKTNAVFVAQGKLSRMVIDPSDYGLSGSLEDLKGGEPKLNLALFEKILKGDRGVLAKTVCLNAAVVIWLANHGSDIKEAYELACERLFSGEVARHFTSIVEAAKALANQK